MPSPLNPSACERRRRLPNSRTASIFPWGYRMPRVTTKRAVSGRMDISVKIGMEFAAETPILGTGLQYRRRRGGFRARLSHGLGKRDHCAARLSGERHDQKHRLALWASWQHSRASWPGGVAGPENRDHRHSAWLIRRAFAFGDPEKHRDWNEPGVVCA